jgi:hypothetical protein
MDGKKQIKNQGSDIIKASEIGQYHYCSIAWYLQKCGYKPKSPMLEIGIKKHMELGKIIDNTQIKIKRYKYLAIAGYLLFILGFLIFLFEVII